MIFAFLHDLLHLLPVSLILVSAFVFDIPAITSFIMTVIADLFWLLLAYQKRRVRLLVSGLLLITGGVYLFINQQIFDQLLVFQLIIICLLSLIITRLSQRYKTVRLVTAVLLIAFILFAIITRTRIRKLALLMIFFYLLLVLVEKIQTDWQKQGNTDLNRHSVYIAPFLLLFVLLMSQIRIPEKPYEWTLVSDGVWWVRASWESLNEKFKSAENKKIESLFIGYSDVAAIGSDLKIVSYKVMNVYSGFYGDVEMKLAGKSYDRFEDLHWVKTDDSEMDYRTFDALETMAAVIAYADENYLDYYRYAFLDIGSTNLVTSHVFAPLKSLPYLDKAAIVQEGSDLYFRNTIRKEYKIRYFQLLRNKEDFSELVSKRKQLTSADYDKALDKIHSADPGVYNYEAFKNYQKRIHEIYGQPVNVTPRTAELLDAVTEGAGNDYEKLLKIEEFLSSMKYDLNPGQLPENVRSPEDFLDQLLFKSQKGYCVHYATAFVLLARSEGIPARYVQGYSFPFKSGRGEVRSDKAHAWPEVYLEDFGWLSFEPTPGKGTSETGSVNPLLPPISEEPEPEDDEPPVVIVEEEEIEEEESEHPDFVLPLSIGVGLLLIAIIIERQISRYHFRKLEPQQQIRILFRQNLRLLKRMKSGIRDDETLSEYAQRLKDSELSAISDDIAVYEELIYGQRIIKQEDVSPFISSNDLLRRKYLNYLLTKLRRKQQIEP